MPTAIARFYAPEGFAIAADGLKSNLRQPSLSTTNNQKIFEITIRADSLRIASGNNRPVRPMNESDDIVFELLPRRLAESVLKQANQNQKLCSTMPVR